MCGAREFALIQPEASAIPSKAAEGGRGLVPARQFAAAAVTASLIAGGFMFFTPHVAQAQQLAQASSRVSANTCEEAVGLSVLPSPVAPWKGAPLRVIVAVEKPLEGELSLIGPNGSVAAKSRERLGGPPYFWYAEVAAPAAGTWHAQLTRDGGSAGCGTISRDITVSAAKPASPHQTAGSLWPVRHTWSRATENLYSAWIEKLFDAPLDASPSWEELHGVLRDESRNVLVNHLGLNEDSLDLVI